MATSVEAIVRGKTRYLEEQEGISPNNEQC